MLIAEYILGKKFTKELEDTVVHEPIYYELKDHSRDYCGHGNAFLKRATELGIVGNIELVQCHSLEEIEQTPRRIKLVKISLKEVE